MKKRYYLATAFSRRFTLLLLAALLFSALQATADVDLTLKVWRGYNTFYGEVMMVATNPAPDTYYRVESPNNKIWCERGSVNNSLSFDSASYAALLDECTNGVWTLIRNVSDTSAQTNTFSVSLTGISANMFGDITMVEPLWRAEALTNPPAIQWTSTSTFPEILVYVWDNHPPVTLNDHDTLPGTATSWTPAVMLSGVDQLLLIQYQTKKFSGATFNMLSGPSVPGWRASVDLYSYLYTEFRLPGGGGSEFGIAVESPGLNWTTGGEYGGEDWFVQSSEYTVGTSALQSGYVSDYASSWLETTVMGPGRLSFDWGIFADEYDYVEFSAVDQYDDEFASSYSYGSEPGGWEFGLEVYLEPGPNVLRWTFYNEDTTAGYYDAAFLDNVVYSPEAVDYEVTFYLEIEHVTTGGNDYYVMFPRVETNSNSPTYDEVASPSRGSSGTEDSSSSSHYATFQDLIAEIQGGEWHLVFDVEGGYHEYNFTIDTSALTVSDLPPTVILYPLDNATGVATNTFFQWAGPTTFDSLYVYDRDNEANTTVGSANLSVTQTSWNYGGALPVGTNTFTASYSSNDYTGLVISEPSNGSNPLAAWSTSVSLSSRGYAQFVTTPIGFIPLPVTLLSSTLSNNSFGLSFFSQAGATHTVQCTTNLVVGPWLPVTNFFGTGALELLTLPRIAPAAFYRVETQ